MKAMQLQQYGAEAGFTQVDIDIPEPAAGEVLIRVAASSVNTVDTMIHQMGADLSFAPALPAILGMDFAGTVTAVGDGVTEFAVGDEVYGCAGGLADLQGSLAEYMVADRRLIAKKPASLSMKQAAALPLVGITAYEGLMRAGTHAGQRVLVHGGTGGVGHVAVQIARALGAEVYSTVHSDEQKAIIRGYGAEPVDYKALSAEEYTQALTGGAGFDVVYDTVGGTNMTNSFAAAALNGQVITTVSMLELDMTPAHFKGLSVHVVFMLIPMLHNHKREQHNQILTALALLADQGQLQPLLDRSEFALADVGKAYQRLSSGQATGKVVVEV